MVKRQLAELGDLLTHPVRAHGLRERILSDWLGIWIDPLREFCEGRFGGAVRLPSRKPCRLIFFLDDLDRCEPDKAVARSVLLTEQTRNPGHIPQHGIDIDPRVAVTAIESVHDKFYSAAAVSGYEYLDKIVNMPFSILALVTAE